MRIATEPAIPDSPLPSLLGSAGNRILFRLCSPETPRPPTPTRGRASPDHPSAQVAHSALTESGGGTGMISVMASESLRTALVTQLIGDGVLRDPRWIDAFTAVRRELFVPYYFDTAGGRPGWRLIDETDGQKWLRGVYTDNALVTQLNGIVGRVCLLAWRSAGRGYLQRDRGYVMSSSVGSRRFAPVSRSRNPRVKVSALMSSSRARWDRNAGPRAVRTCASAWGLTSRLRVPSRWWRGARAW